MKIPNQGANPDTDENAARKATAIAQPIL